jgi:diaminohydroxyphosphoribosylaminopyrimidine deaminase / 5-amino-6-(5-phosphoribosylamino)uracil reductase
MRRAIELARCGIGRVAPNPVVGAVIVRDGLIIGEGFHARYGHAHAEVNAIRRVQDPERFKEATLYVTLEPCSHYGKTPPCAELIIRMGIPRVVVGTLDPFHKVSGRGVKMMQEAGVEVIVGCLEAECRQVAREFFCFVEKRRPYVILKWAQSIDGYMDRPRTLESGLPAAQISSASGRVAVHKLRSQVEAIMVGTQTAVMDNPSLTTRLYGGKNPIRVLIDRTLRVPRSYHLFDGKVRTLVFTEAQVENLPGVEFFQIPFDGKLISRILDQLHRLGIQSLLVEGGAHLLQSFIDGALYDEVRIETGSELFYGGVEAPRLH